MKRLASIRANLHWLCALSVELALDRLAADLLSVHIESHLLAVERASHVMPLAVANRLWCHRGTEFYVTPAMPAPIQSPQVSPVLPMANS